MEFKPVITCDNYKKVDGFRAPNSDIEKVDMAILLCEANLYFKEFSLISDYKIIILE